MNGPGPAADAAAFLCQVAAWDLPGAAPPQVPAVLDAPVPFVTSARAEGLSGVLLAAVDAGAVALPPAHVEELVRAHREALLRCLHLEQRLLDLHGWWTDAGIPFVVLKGPAVAHLDLVDPSWRVWSDIDVLVPPAVVERAVADLERRGLERVFAQVRPGFDRRFTKSVQFRCPDRVEIDVHRSLADGAFGFRLPLDRLHDRAVPLPLGGCTLRALDPPARMLHSSYHAVVGSTRPTLANVREIAAYLCSPRLDPAAVVAEARRWRGEAVLAAALALASARLRFDLPEAWRAWHDGLELPARDAVLVERMRSGAAGLAGHKLDVVAELDRWRDRAWFLAGSAFPSAEYLRSQGLRRGERLRTWLPHVLRREVVRPVGAAHPSGRGGGGSG